MARVWRDAKCADFMNADGTNWLQLNEDNFFDFPWYVDKDPRQRPARFGTCNPSPDMQKTMEVAFDTIESNGLPRPKVAMHTIPPDPDEASWLNEDAYEEDPYETHLQKILAPRVDERIQQCRDSHKVPTGIIVIVDINAKPDDGNTYLECICTNASCTYVPRRNNNSCDGVCK
jgi:hypothetical protein